MVWSRGGKENNLHKTRHVRAVILADRNEGKQADEETSSLKSATDNNISHNKYGQEEELDRK